MYVAEFKKPQQQTIELVVMTAKKGKINQNLQSF